MNLLLYRSCTFFPCLLAAQGLWAVEATVETFPMQGRGDIADDPAIWLHPSDPARSVVLGTNKAANAAVNGLYAWDLDGSPATEAVGWEAGVNWTGPEAHRYNNVDLRYRFPTGHEHWDIVVASNRARRTLDVFRIETDASNDFAGLTLVGSFGIGEGFARGTDAPYGLALYQSKRLGRTYAIASDKIGNIAQWRLSFEENGEPGRVITGHRVAFFDATVGDTEVEGMVADDDRDVVYIAGEDEGIYRYPTNDGVIDFEARVLVEAAATTHSTRGNLAADVEGLALYYSDDRAGFLIASSQGEELRSHPAANTFAIYNREFAAGQPNAYLASFSVDGGPDIDAVSMTDGLDVISADLGGAFSEGLLVVHDGGGQSPSNFKFVSWGSLVLELRRR